MGERFTREWFENLLVSMRGLIVTQQGWAVGFIASFVLLDIGLFKSLGGSVIPSWLLVIALLPDWLWWCASYVLLGLSTFVAFHRERQWAEELMAQRDCALKAFSGASQPAGNGEL
jgi:hypothetical protein